MAFEYCIRTDMEKSHPLNQFFYPSSSLNSLFFKVNLFLAECIHSLQMHQPPLYIWKHLEIDVGCSSYTNSNHYQLNNHFDHSSLC